MRIASPSCARRSIASPAGNCSIRSNSSRSSNRSCAGRRRWNRAPRRSPACPTRRRPARSSARPMPLPEPQSGAPLKASPISDTVTFTAPPDREARLESRVLPTVAQRSAAAVEPDRGRRQALALAAAGFARSGRSAADRDAQHARGALRFQGQAHARRARRSRPRRQEGRRNAGGDRRPVRAADGCAATPAPSSASSTASTSRARTSIGSTRTLSAVPVRKPIIGRDRSVLRLRRALGPIPGPARHAHRARFPQQHRRPGARHRQRHGRHRRLERRLRQDGRDRSRQRPLDPLRAPVGDRGEGRPARSRSARSSGASDRPDARPVRTCITRRASMAKRSIRRNSCAPGSGSATRCNSARAAARTAIARSAQKSIGK